MALRSSALWVLYMCALSFAHQYCMVFGLVPALDIHSSVVMYTLIDLSFVFPYKHLSFDTEHGKAPAGLDNFN